MSDFASTVGASESPVLASRRHWLALAVSASTSLVAGPLQARGRKAASTAPLSPLSEPVDLLPAALRERLSETGLAAEGFGLLVQPLDGSAPVLSWQAGRPFVLASTSKLITSMAALDLLGPGYRWRTRAYLSGPLTNGRLLGDLVIRGGGDASLTSRDLLAWFQQLREQGLQEVWGDIILNREAFSLRPQDLVSTPEPSPDRPHHVRPDALALDAGMVSVAVQSDSGGRANIQVTPPLHDAGQRARARWCLHRECHLPGCRRCSATPIADQRPVVGPVRGAADPVCAGQHARSWPAGHRRAVVAGGWGAARACG
jgi:D-alanyl-D-alanine carboxypeptidase/D-alanyl-D-alanine-endopeptidase (penicillin-binding protein 4)